MPKFKCQCGSRFSAPDAATVKEHGELCPSCYDMRQVLAFANSAGDTISESKALEVIKGIAITRLEHPRG